MNKNTDSLCKVNLAFNDFVNVSISNPQYNMSILHTNNLYFKNYNCSNAIHLYFEVPVWRSEKSITVSATVEVEHVYDFKFLLFVSQVLAIMYMIF
jgi:hypothetical protein